MRATHRSKRDGSYAEKIEDHEDGSFTLMNETGYTWRAHPIDWADVSAQKLPDLYFIRRIDDRHWLDRTNRWNGTILAAQPMTREMADALIPAIIPAVEVVKYTPLPF